MRVIDRANRSALAEVIAGRQLPAYPPPNSEEWTWYIDERRSSA